jgi:peptidoglycan/LPS O-acetylase OafA/YrhL
MASLLWPILGAVRFFLALIVAGYHIIWFAPESELATSLARMSGFAAVLGFLVISGFSIAASHAKQPAGFYRRRFLRIVPLYVLAIAAGALCTSGFGGSVRAASGSFYATPATSDVLQNLFFLQGFTTTSIATNAVVWTLSIEVFFYLLTPLWARLSQSALMVIAAASLGLFFLGPWLDTPFYPMMLHGNAAAALAWAWLAGFIAFRHRDHAAAALVVLGVFLLALSVNYRGLTIHWPITLGTVAMALGFGHRLAGPHWLAAILTRLGDASYPLYLSHIPLYIVLKGMGANLSGAAYLGAAVVLAITLDRLYDQPVKNLARTWLARRRQGAIAPAPF